MALVFPGAASGRNQGLKIRWAPRAFSYQLSALRIIDLRNFFAKRKEVTDEESIPSSRYTWSSTGLRFSSRRLQNWILIVAFALLSLPARAQSPDYPAKLTFGNYYQGGNTGFDTNLRYSIAEWTGWIGYYTTDDFSQTRVGLQFDWHSRWLYVMPSVQVASHEFFGGSAYAEIGERFYAIAGFSRTNLKPYVNLTFDPNESWQAGVGVHINARSTIALFTVWDNRLDTGQQISHLSLRHYFAKSQRVAVDISYKSGHGDEGVYFRGAAANIEYDCGRWFVKVAGDQHANFGEDTMWRFGGGLRF